MIFKVKVANYGAGRSIWDKMGRLKLVSGAGALISAIWGGNNRDLQGGVCV